jgi:hypothetical protein
MGSRFQMDLEIYGNAPHSFGASGGGAEGRRVHHTQTLRGLRYLTRAHEAIINRILAQIRAGRDENAQRAQRDIP